VRAYRSDLQRFLVFTGETASIEDCDRTTLHSYVERLFKVHKLRESSAKRHVASLRSMTRWLVDEAMIGDDPFRHARVRIRISKRLPRILSRAEIAALLQVPSGSEFSDMTARVAVELLFATGIRVAELSALRDEDVDLENAVLTVFGKGDRERRVYVPDAELRELFTQYRELRSKRHPSSTMYLVNSRGTAASPPFLRRLVRRLAAVAGISRRLTPHMLRHSLATYLLEEGLDIRYVQRLLGHRSIATTEIYTQVADVTLKVRVTERHPRKMILNRP